MTIGIDISQIVYEGTGVGRYVRNLVRETVSKGQKHSFVLFGTSFRKREVLDAFVSHVKRDRTNVRSVILPLPPVFMDFLWNILHIVPVEWFTGKLDVFWSSDWTQPPLVHARGVTTIHDLTVYRFPESFDSRIVDVHKRKLARSKRECRMFFCDSEATKRDAENIVGIPVGKLKVVYPGI